MDLKQYKSYFVLVLFICCLGVAGYYSLELLNNINDSYEIVNSKTINTEFKFDMQNVEVVELPLWAKACYNLLNIVWALFIGGLIYARNKSLH